MKKTILALSLALASASSFAGVNFSVGASQLSHNMELHNRQETGASTTGSEFFAYEGDSQMIELGIGYDFTQHLGIELKHHVKIGGDSEETKHSGSTRKYWESHDSYQPNSITDLSFRLSSKSYYGFKPSISMGVSVPNVEMGPASFDESMFNLGVGLGYKIDKNLSFELAYVRYLETNGSNSGPSGYTSTTKDPEGGEDIVRKISNYEKMRWSADRITLGVKYSF